MKYLKPAFIWSLVLLSLLLLACGSQPLPSESFKDSNPLLGAWEMKEVHWVGADTTYSIFKTQPGLFTISPSRYTLMWTPTRSPRTPFKVLSKPTDEEIKAGFQSVIFNGGTYKIANSKLVTTASIAKVPGFEGGQQFYEFLRTADKLELTMYDETYPDGTKPEWSGKWKTKFILEKAR